MKLTKIETGNFKLDGGAMFGVVPKTLWSKEYPADENNLCNLSMRCLLAEDDGRLILIDTGIGNKQSEKFFSHYYLNGEDTLQNSLRNAGYTFEDITDVFLTHLHFDHCGAAVQKDENGNYLPAFAKATYWTSEKQWLWAMQPNQREKASYLKENFLPLMEQEKLKLIEKEGPFSSHISIRFFDGHSGGLMLPLIKIGSQTLVYVSDLVPTHAHIPESWVCGYDTRPLVAMKEREQFYQECIRNDYVLFFEHDISVECCRLIQTEKGARMGDSFSFSDFLKSVKQ